MRRKDREITDIAALARILDACPVLRIGLSDGTPFPYIVPVSFAYEIEGREVTLYFHGATAGRKYELLDRNRACSFECDSADALVADPVTRDATMHYRSAMGCATVEFLEGEEKRRALDLLMQRDPVTRDFAYDTAPIPRTAVVKLRVVSWTAKANPNPMNND